MPRRKLMEPPISPPSASRLGVKYSQGMGNGLSAHGLYEFSTTTDNEEGGGIDDTRVATVGMCPVRSVAN